MKNNYKTFESMLIYHCAPTLSGLKSANMINLKKGDILNIHEKISNFNTVSKLIKIKILCECEQKVLILVYNKKMLHNELCQKKYKCILKKFNYSYNLGLNAMLEQLSQKIKSNNDFPHEIGIFLGYPIEDVIGFIRFKGAKFKISGYWKVYGDENKAKYLFDSYTNCKNNLCFEYNNGKSFYDLIKSA